MRYVLSLILDRSAAADVTVHVDPELETEPTGRRRQAKSVAPFESAETRTQQVREGMVGLQGQSFSSDRLEGSSSNVSGQAEAFPRPILDGLRKTIDRSKRRQTGVTTDARVVIEKPVEQHRQAEAAGLVRAAKI